MVPENIVQKNLKIPEAVADLIPQQGMTAIGSRLHTKAVVEAYRRGKEENGRLKNSYRNL